jgi:hypothetical protein
MFQIGGTRWAQFIAPTLFHFLRVCYNQHRNGTFAAVLCIHTGAYRTSAILLFPCIRGRRMGNAFKT